MNTELRPHGLTLHESSYRVNTVGDALMPASYHNNTNQNNSTLLAMPRHELKVLPLQKLDLQTLRELRNDGIYYGQGPITRPKCEHYYNTPTGQQWLNQGLVHRTRTPGVAHWPSDQWFLHGLIFGKPNSILFMLVFKCSSLPNYIVKGATFPLIM